MPDPQFRPSEPEPTVIFLIAGKEKPPPPGASAPLTLEEFQELLREKLTDDLERWI